jgi:xylan 1,4-beta-xylosidase
MYSSYTAACFARKHDLADRHGVNFAGALTWAFTFEDQPYFAGFRQLASCGLPLPVFNVIRMFSLMNGKRITAESDTAVSLDNIMRRGVRETPDVGVLASLYQSNVTKSGPSRKEDFVQRRLCVMVWHYHDDDLPGPDAAVSIALAGLPPDVNEAKLTHYRVDANRSNAYDEWRRMGSPIAPTERQYRQLQDASNLAKLGEAPAVLHFEHGATTLNFSLPRQGVSLLVADW